MITIRTGSSTEIHWNPLDPTWSARSSAFTLLHDEAHDASGRSRKRFIKHLPSRNDRSQSAFVQRSNEFKKKSTTSPARSSDEHGRKHTLRQRAHSGEYLVETSCFGSTYGRPYVPHRRLDRECLDFKFEHRIRSRNLRCLIRLESGGRGLETSFKTIGQPGLVN